MATVGIAERAVLDAINSPQGYEQNRTDPVPGLVIEKHEVLPTMKVNQGEDFVTSIIPIVLSAAFNTLLFRLYEKM